MCYIGAFSAKWAMYGNREYEIINYSFYHPKLVAQHGQKWLLHPKNQPNPSQTGAKNKIKLRLPSDSSYSKWIFPSIISCYSDRRKPDILAATDLVADRQ
ncbi:hypothetical protein AVEN_173749-1 [Araneus ventricosus]|uniref:Uncharacterized protein n=1 Tax=Araneus ventricosus TaxID=182803 RepID=A0A4Y2Q5A7_ARAVE|nr:hypothetical protein AVEN_136108-1 [Araneus ventricosus]GBN58643.1 hypothetical protein AVEN_173749-1 [Araneus ventricosus]